MGLTETDAVLQAHAAKLQKMYDDRTAGDHSFLGALASFLMDVDKVRGDFTREIMPWLVGVAESMTSDKSNDWSEELNRLAEITGDADFAPEVEDWTIVRR